MQDADQVVEAAAESVAVVAGPELYGPWIEHSRYGLYADSLADMVPLARQLVERPQQRLRWFQGHMQGSGLSVGDFVAVAHGPVSPS